MISLIPMVEADLSIEQVGVKASHQKVQIKTKNDGTLFVATSGRSPRIRVHDLWKSRNILRRITDVTGQSLIVEHHGRRIVSTSRVRGKSKVRVHFLATLFSLIDVNRSR